jgi:DNA-binding response OmpR family regulator
MLTLKSTISPSTVQVVMIISDQGDTPLLWETPFQEKGFTTVHETQENALKTCRVVDPALVVIDTHLPHAKKLEFCSNLRAVVSGTILLLVSDYNSSQMVDIYNVGVDECLLKPVSPAFIMVKAISWFLRRRWLDKIQVCQRSIAIYNTKISRGVRGDLIFHLRYCTL